MTHRPIAWNVGSDRVTLQGGDRLSIVSRVSMAGWEVRKHRASLIRFDDRTWRVAARIESANGDIRYTLEPWHPAEQELVGPEIDYGPDYVARRDVGLSMARRRGRFVLPLRLVAPLAGFLPARTKARLEADYGLDPVASTSQSVILELAIAFLALILAPLAMAAHLFQAVDWLVLVAIVALVDGGIRWDRILGEQRPPPGFYEWLIARRRRRGAP